MSPSLILAIRQRRPVRALLAACVFIVCFSFPFIAFGIQGGEGRWVSEVKGLMGTRFVLRAWVESEEQEKAIARALQRVSELQNRWSPWIEGSDLHRLNEAAGGALVKVESKQIWKHR